ncbi:MAG: SIS domain-containing protein [Candidatus Korarchaeum sp.]
MVLREPGVHMSAEIHEQPEAVERTLRESLNEVRDAVSRLDVSFVYVTGSGSSFHSSLALSRALMRIAGVSSTAIQASELPEWIPPDVRDSALIAISQSGESRDVLTAVESFRRISSNSPVLAITNTPDSTLCRISDAFILTRAGEERAIAATKTYTTQLVASFLLSIELAERRRRDIGDLREELLKIPHLIRETLRSSKTSVRFYADSLKGKEFGFILGKGPNYPTALESALKLRETANLHYVGYSAREFLHGPLQLVSKGTPVILILGSDVGDVAQRVRVLGGDVIRVDVGGDIPIPEVSYELSPIVTVVPMQMLSLELSILRGLDPDRPEKLTKVVR